VFGSVCIVCVCVSRSRAELDEESTDEEEDAIAMKADADASLSLSQPPLLMPSTVSMVSGHSAPTRGSPAAVLMKQKTAAELTPPPVAAVSLTPRDAKVTMTPIAGAWSTRVAPTPPRTPAMSIVMGGGSKASPHPEDEAEDDHGLWEAAGLPVALSAIPRLAELRRLRNECRRAALRLHRVLASAVGLEKSIQV
jgi:hypothetical protein